MANAKPKIAALAVAALIIAAGVTWYLASPAWTLHRMKAAVDADDPAALDSYVDYPALRQDLKAKAMGRLAAEAEKDRTGLRGLGVAIGRVVVGPVIDRAISPAGVRAALMARQEQAQFGRETRAMSALHLPSDPVIVRRGFSEFLVTTKRQPTSGLVFRRHGLSWKLSGVELPAN